jgi:hypothetical protein
MAAFDKPFNAVEPLAMCENHRTRKVTLACIFCHITNWKNLGVGLDLMGYTV